MPRCNAGLIFEELKPFLLNDEWILWKGIKNENLLKFIYILTPLIVLLLFLIVLTIVLILYVGWILIVIILLLIYGLFLCISGIQEGYLHIKNISDLSFKELKNFQTYEVITNKNYIIKNFYFFIDTDFTLFVPESLKILNNIIFLSINYIKSVIVDRKYKKIEILVQGVDSKLIRDIYITYSEHEETQLVKLLIDILKLRKIRENKDFIFYIRKHQE
ncbi:MAG: hypothetical protein JXA99_09140 [Candidatus Lokiarchaeota archaeon]|nr:hypothetical protein [Candidatus Lokiarchaeota archaeon]